MYKKFKHTYTHGVCCCLSARAEEPEHKDRRGKKTQNAFRKAAHKRMEEWKDERMKNHLIFNP